jgi:Domain of unknown function (DUF4166)
VAAVADPCPDAGRHSCSSHLRTRVPKRSLQSVNLESHDRRSVGHRYHLRLRFPDGRTMPQKTYPVMRSIYEQSLGEKFKLLHPRIQQRFGFSSKDRCASVGSGIMDRIWRGRFFTLPFLYAGSWRRIMFPESGTAVPFSISNYAYSDPFGRETVTWIRTFETRHPRRFDAYMIFSKERGCVVDYLGTHQHLAADIHLSADERGGLRLRSGHNAFTKGSSVSSSP